MFHLHLDLEPKFTEPPGGTNYKVLNNELKALKLRVF